MAAFCIALPVLPGKKEVFKEFGKTATAPGGGSLRHQSGGWAFPRKPGFCKAHPRATSPWSTSKRGTWQRL